MIETNEMKVNYNMTISVSWDWLKRPSEHIEFRPVGDNLFLLDANGELWLLVATSETNLTYGKVIENPNFAVKH